VFFVIQIHLLKNPIMNRRNFLQTAALTYTATTLPAIDPFRRKSHKFSGLSMTSYSMKPHMKWWWGKETEGKLDMLGFLDYCAVASDN